MAAPLVSIVTPSYNQAEFIEDTLLSVRNQTHRPIEHLVIDGGSTDGTTNILRQYEDEYPLTWTSEPDEGQSHAINKGFDRANGDIVGWLNSDDVYFDTGVLARVVRYFDELDADVIYGDIGLIDRDSTVIGVSARPPFDINQLIYRNLIAQPATFFRGPVVTEHRLATDLDYSMDYEFWLRLAQSYSFTHVADILAGFRIHEGQKTESVAAMAEEGATISRDYMGDGTGEVGLFRDIVPTEYRRLLRSVRLTLRFIRHQPDLAFSGEFASVPRMVSNVFPRRSDINKALERLRDQ